MEERCGHILHICTTHGRHGGDQISLNVPRAPGLTHCLLTLCPPISTPPAPTLLWSRLPPSLFWMTPGDHTLGSLHHSPSAWTVSQNISWTLWSPPGRLCWNAALSQHCSQPVTTETGDTIRASLKWSPTTDQSVGSKRTGPGGTWKMSRTYHEVYKGGKGKVM